MTAELAILIGEFGEGAYGPTILFTARLADGVELLRMVFEHLASSPPGSCIQLDDDPRVSLSAALWSLELRVVAEPHVKHLCRSDEGGFIWDGTQEEWETASLLIEPLIQQVGHQYLTSETVDEALVELSRGEDHG